MIECNVSSIDTISFDPQCGHHLQWLILLYVELSTKWLNLTAFHLLYGETSNCSLCLRSSGSYSCSSSLPFFASIALFDSLTPSPNLSPPPSSLFLSRSLWHSSLVLLLSTSFSISDSISSSPSPRQSALHSFFIRFLPGSICFHSNASFARFLFHTWLYWTNKLLLTY